MSKTTNSPEMDLQSHIDRLESEISALQAQQESASATLETAKEIFEEIAVNFELGECSETDYTAAQAKVKEAQSSANIQPQITAKRKAIEKIQERIRDAENAELIEKARAHEAGRVDLQKKYTKALRAVADIEKDITDYNATAQQLENYIENRLGSVQEPGRNVRGYVLEKYGFMVNTIPVIGNVLANRSTVSLSTLVPHFLSKWGL
jgi:chromosome segregation ATPase